MNYMSQNDIDIASAINLADVAAHPAEAMAAMIEVMKRQGAEIESLQDNQAILFRLLAKLKAQVSPEPTEAQADRAMILKALLAANQGKMFAKDARQKMRIPKATFSRLLAHMKADIEVREFHADRRRDLIILKSSENG